MDNQNYLKLKSQFSSFAKVNFFQYNEFGGNEPTGVFCTVFTEIKKDDSLERIKAMIAKDKIPFSVSEQGLERTKHFIIKF